MKALPHEPIEKKKSKKTSSKNIQSNQAKVRFTRSKFDKLRPDQLEIKKLANRIYHFANIETTRDSEVFDLIADTKAKLIKLHIARKNLTQKKKRGQH
ncbi:hypothetical protein IT412_01360 [Candidatus Peregrinibacteria bacterium]|nr:hypothetical protein [Candidatus Peregrinibacteria bacterium]